MGLEYMESMGLKSVAVKVFCCCRRPFSFLYYGKPIFFFIYNTFKRTGSGVTKSNFAHDDGKKFYKSVNISA